MVARCVNHGLIVSLGAQTTAVLEELAVRWRLAGATKRKCRSVAPGIGPAMFSGRVVLARGSAECRFDREPRGLAA